MSQVNLVQNESRATAALQVAMCEVQNAHTPGELKAARKHLHKAEDKFVKADTRLHRAQAFKTQGFHALFNTSRYQGIAKHHLANLERTGFARSPSHVACPHYVSTEARQRATIGSLLGQVGQFNSQLEGLMGRLASSSTASATGAAGGDPDLMNILNDPSLGIEDKLALFMAKYVEKNNQELENKMKELAAAKSGQKTDSTSATSGTSGTSTSTSTSTSTGAATKKDGWFSSAKSFFKHLGHSLPKLAGTIIGGMYGGPMGAYLGSKAGGWMGDQISGMHKSDSTAQANGTQANGTQANGTQANGTQANGTQANGTQGAKDTTTLEAELQRLTQKREQLTKMLTDLMSALHRTTMSVVANIKP